MARKNNLVTQIATAQSLSAAFQSAPTVIRDLDNCSYQINITTTNSTGTFTIQGSDDYYVQEPTNTVMNPGTWVDIPLSATLPVAAANETILVSLNQLPFYAIRVSYIPVVAGTGTAAIYITDKMLG